MIERAVSIKQPWLYAIEQMGKSIENRTWKPPVGMRGKRIALHASKSPDRPAFTSLGVFDRQVTKGAITSTAVLAGHIEPYQTSAVSYLPKYDHLVQLLRVGNPWHIEDQYGWVFADVKILKTPMFCKGALSFWRLPEDVKSLINNSEVILSE